jgi:hypothetical protein
MCGINECQFRAHLDYLRSHQRAVLVIPPRIAIMLKAPFGCLAGGRLLPHMRPSYRLTLYAITRHTVAQDILLALGTAFLLSVQIPWHGSPPCRVCPQAATPRSLTV